MYVLGIRKFKNFSIEIFIKHFVAFVKCCLPCGNWKCLGSRQPHSLFYYFCRKYWDRFNLKLCCSSAFCKWADICWRSFKSVSFSIMITTILYDYKRTESSEKKQIYKNLNCFAYIWWKMYKNWQYWWMDGWTVGCHFATGLFQKLHSHRHTDRRTKQHWYTLSVGNTDRLVMTTFGD